MLYLVVCGNRFHGQSALSVPQNIFPLLHRGEKHEKPFSLVPLHLEGASLLLGKSRGDILQHYQPRMAHHICPQQKHWGFPLLPLQTFLPFMVSLHKAEIKGDSEAVLLPQRPGNSKNIPLLLQAEYSPVWPLFPLFSSQLLGSNCGFSPKTRTFAYQMNNFKGCAGNN